jgi:polar amino acid transport system substrate-binding protein
MNWTLNLLVLVSTWLLLPLGITKANSTELKVAFVGNRPPYCFNKDDIDQGIEIDLLKRILGDAGYKIKITLLPKIRLTKAVRDKEVDAAATVQNGIDNSLFFSDVYLEFQNLVISKTSSAFELTHIDDLKQHSFVIWQDGWRNLGQEFENQYRPDSAGNFKKNYYQAHNQLSQNKMFWANRVQLIIVDKTIFEHHKKILANEFNTAIGITYHDLFKIKTPYSVVFNDPVLLNKFNSGLRKLRASGDYQKIIDRYK